MTTTAHGDQRNALDYIEASITCRCAACGSSHAFDGITFDLNTNRISTYQAIFCPIGDYDYGKTYFRDDKRYRIVPVAGKDVILCPKCYWEYRNMLERHEEELNSFVNGSSEPKNAEK